MLENTSKSAQDARIGLARLKKLADIEEEE
jgi:hypothetical protein